MAGLAASFGSGAMTNSIEDLATSAGCYLLIGANTTEAHPIIGYRIRQAVRRGGAKLIVVNPRWISLCQDADLWLQIRPGTDIALVNGLIHIILKEGLWDEEFVRERTEGIEELRKSVEAYTPEMTSRMTGISVADLERAARLYATGGASEDANAQAGDRRPAAVLYAMGVTQHICGTGNVEATANLAMVTGNIGKPGCGVNPLRGQSNVQGSCDMGGLPNYLPGYKFVTDDESRARLEKLWFGPEGAQTHKLPDKPGLTLVEMLNAATDGKIKAMYIMGENPMVMDPDTNHVRHALESLDFLVVQDIFLTETAQYADVVLPGASFAEKDGTFTNTERRVQRVRQAIPPVGNSRPDWKIISEISTRLGLPMNYESPEAIMKEINQAVPTYAGITYEKIEEKGIQWPCPTAEHPGTPILHVDKFVRGKGKFYPLEFVPAAELPDAEYPLIFTTGRSLFHFHSGTMTRRSKGLNAVEPEAAIEMNPADAQQLGIKNGDEVRVRSRRGSLVTKARVNKHSPKGMAYMNMHFREAAANVLTNPALDPIAKIPEYKACAVRIEKDGAND